MTEALEQIPGIERHRALGILAFAEQREPLEAIRVDLEAEIRTESEAFLVALEPVVRRQSGGGEARAKKPERLAEGAGAGPVGLGPELCGERIPKAESRAQGEQAEECLGVAAADPDRDAVRADIEAAEQTDRQQRRRAHRTPPLREKQQRPAAGPPRAGRRRDPVAGPPWVWRPCIPPGGQPLVRPSDRVPPRVHDRCPNRRRVRDARVSGTVTADLSASRQP